jgi:hypothetical protein
MSPLRKWWGRALLFTTGLTGLFLLAGFFNAMLPTSWSNWMPILFCWGSLLSFGLIIMALMGFINQSPQPDFNYYWVRLPWAFIGGLALFSFPFLSNWLWGRSHNAHVFDLACFGTVFFLIGFGFGLAAGKYILLIILGFLTIVTRPRVAVILGNTPAMILETVIILSIIGTVIYRRLAAVTSALSNEHNEYGE